MLPLRDIVERKRLPIVNVTLIALNIAIFIWSLRNFEAAVFGYGFIPAKWSLFTAFTSMFLHGGLDHLIGNMWYLWIFGDNVEDRFGHAKYLVFYLASGLMAAFVHYLTDPLSKIPTIGASGAISGVLGAYAIFFPKAKVLVLFKLYFTFIPAFIMIGFWFILQLIFGTISLLGGIGSGIAYWAHIGGFVFGLFAGLLYRTLFKKSSRYTA